MEPRIFGQDWARAAPMNPLALARQKDVNRVEESASVANCVELALAQEGAKQANRAVREA